MNLFSFHSFLKKNIEYSFLSPSLWVIAVIFETGISVIMLCSIIYNAYYLFFTSLEFIKNKKHSLNFSCKFIIAKLAQTTG